MNKNYEWIGGKQVYPPQDNTNNEDDNWWDLDPEFFGIGVSGFKPKKDSFKVDKREEDNDSIQMGE